jgi:transcriptional regulator with XRE-family HTH domain
MSAKAKNAPPPLFKVEVMRALKEASGQSWRQIAERSGLSPSYLMDLNGGQINDPSTGTVGLIAKGLDVSPIVLLGYSDDDAWQAGLQEGIFRCQEALSKLRS